MATTSIYPEENVGKIIFQVKDDLNRLKLKLEKVGETAESEELRATIEQTEKSIKMHADALLTQMHCRVNNFPSIGDDRKFVNEDKTVPWTLYPQGEQDFLSVKRTGSGGFLESRGAHTQQLQQQQQEIIWTEPLNLAPGDRVKRQHAARAIFNPHNSRNRQEIHDRYGIGLPLISTKDSSGKPPAGGERIVKGSTIGKLAVMKQTQAQRQNGPMEISENDARKGLLSLMERGLIPSTAEVEWDPPPVQNRALALLDNENRAQLSFPADQTELGFQLSGYQLDETTNVADIANYPGLPKVITDVLRRHEVAAAARSAKQRKREEESPNRRRTSLPGLTNNNEMRMAVVTKEELNKQKTQETTYDNMFAPPPTTPASQASKTQPISNFRFAIQNGRTRTDVRNYIMFKQHYTLSWGGIVKIIRLLETLLKKFSIPIAFIDGNKLAHLSVEFEVEFNPTEDELLSCIVNRQDVERLMFTPGRLFVGESGHIRAATKIQSMFRAYVARKEYLHFRQKKWAAGVIAIRWLLYVKMTSVKQQLKQTRLRQMENNKRRFDLLTASWDSFCNNRRVIIHIPSMAYPLSIRQKLEKLPLLQNQQMSRLCDIKDDNVDVIYVSPVPISDELIQYYSRLMALKSAIQSGNVKDQKPLTERYKIIVPEAIKSFADHRMCLSTLLKYSPRALKRIKNIINGRQAIIVPGLMHADDLAVADYLACPVLGSLDPQVAQLYTSKSGARRIFASSNLTSIAPAECDIYNFDQLCEVLAVLITENLSVKRWLLKIDHEFGSRGIASIDIGIHWPSYKWALKERARYGDKWKKKWAQENVYNRILTDLPEMLENHLVLADKTAYPTWNVFKSAYFTQGGIIEAYPYADSVTNISVALLLEPSGNVRCLNSGDQIHAQNPLSCWGLSVPQASIESDVLNVACEKIALACTQRNIYGHITIDFATFLDSDNENQILWPTDLDIYYSEYAGMQQLALFATNGVFNVTEHAIMVPILPHPPPQLPQAAAKKRPGKTDSETCNNTTTSARYVTMSCSLNHSNLAAVHYSVFFQMCRAHGVGFDVKEKVGTIFTLVDSFDRQTMGMITIGATFEKALQLLAKNLYVIHEEISSSKMQGKSNFKAVISEVESILGQAVDNMDTNT